MIKMIAGTFGAKINGRLTAITPEHGPFSYDKATEERLVKAGVAAYVEEQKAPAGGSNGKEGLDALTYQDLQKLAKELDLDPNGKKVDLIARIEEAQKAPAAPAPDATAPNVGAGEPGAGGNEPEPPTFDPAKTVVS
jgi:hypothetical protein